MAKIDLLMPKMGESIMEATILKWVKQPGDSIKEDDTILEIATDKVDSEIPSPVDGVLAEILFKENDVVEIGKVIARIEVEGEASSEVIEIEEVPVQEAPKQATTVASNHDTNGKIEKAAPVAMPSHSVSSSSGRFLSPLVKNIAKQENISIAELDTLLGSGKNGRVTKNDILQYLEKRNKQSAQPVMQATAPAAVPAKNQVQAPTPSLVTDGSTEIIEMDRMRKLIADHMVKSVHTSPHVTSFVEADVTNIVTWRNSIKQEFQKTYGEKITYTPIFIDAVIKAIRDFPMVNISLDGNSIIKKNFINIGMAAALPSGNLIVPVIKNADMLNLVGLTKSVNDLAKRARENALKPEEIQGGTFTVTNVGTFGNVMGTPIINQPQVAILATGAIRKKPAVVETEYGDLIAVRHMMFLSLSYDHRIVDGFLGGSFLRRIADYLESFDKNISI